MKKRKEWGPLTSIIAGVAYTLITYLLCAGIFSIIAYALMLENKYLAVLSMLALFISGATAGCIIGRRAPSRRLLSALLTSLPTVLLILCIGLIKNGYIGGAGIVNCVIFTLSTILFAFPLIRRGRGRRKRSYT